MWLIDKEIEKICFSDGKFHTETRDWNHDGDVYTDTVMVIHYLSGDDAHIHRYDLEDYKEVSEEYVREKLTEELDKYFLKGDGYYCDPTYYGKHYGDYSFIKGGRCIYDGDRDAAIQKEIEYIVNKGGKTII